MHLDIQHDNVMYYMKIQHFGDKDGISGDIITFTTAAQPPGIIIAQCFNHLTTETLSTHNNAAIEKITSTKTECMFDLTADVTVNTHVRRYNDIFRSNFSSEDVISMVHLLSRMLKHINLILLNIHVISIVW